MKNVYFGHYKCTCISFPFSNFDDGLITSITNIYELNLKSLLLYI